MHCIRAFAAHLRQSREITKTLQQAVNRNQLFHLIPRRFSSQIHQDTDEIVQKISQGDKELEKKLRILMLEVEVMRQDGRPAPDTLKADQWQQLLTLNTKNQRSQYLLFLFKTEKSKENLKVKKEARRKELEESPPVIRKEYEDDLLYGIQHQSLFLRIRDQSINNMDNYKTLQAMRDGQSVVIDCSYEEYMVYREIVNSAKQMTFVFGDNRIHKNPFNIHLCNVNTGGTFMKQMRKNIPSLDEPWFPLNIHSESYLDIFPKEKLVYLTPHCREELTHFDHDAVYIVGCMVDKVNNEPLSLAKAKRDGLKMAKLPLDRYLEWAPGAKKNLNINHMIPILLDLKCTNNWEHSLQHIPRRKLMETKIFAMQKKLRHNKSTPFYETYKDFKDSKRMPRQNQQSSASKFDEAFNDFKMPNKLRVDLRKEKKHKYIKSLFDE